MGVARQESRGADSGKDAGSQNTPGAAYAVAGQDVQRIIYLFAAPNQDDSVVSGNGSHYAYGNRRQGSHEPGSRRYRGETRHGSGHDSQGGRRSLPPGEKHPGRRGCSGRCIGGDKCIGGNAVGR